MNRASGDMAQYVAGAFLVALANSRLVHCCVPAEHLIPNGPALHLTPDVVPLISFSYHLRNYLAYSAA